MRALHLALPAPHPRHLKVCDVRARQQDDDEGAGEHQRRQDDAQWPGDADQSRPVASILPVPFVVVRRTLTQQHRQLVPHSRVRRSGSQASDDSDAAAFRRRAEDAAIPCDLAIGLQRQPQVITEWQWTVPTRTRNAYDKVGVLPDVNHSAGNI